jgi:hypothetical protein
MYSRCLNSKYRHILLELSATRQTRPCLNRCVSILSPRLNSDSNSSVRYKESFVSRHIGINDQAQSEMLKVLSVNTLDELTVKTVPKEIAFNRELNLSLPMS